MEHHLLATEAWGPSLDCDHCVEGLQFTNGTLFLQHLMGEFGMISFCLTGIDVHVHWLTTVLIHDEYSICACQVLLEPFDILLKLSAQLYVTFDWALPECG